MARRDQKSKKTKSKPLTQKSKSDKKAPAKIKPSAVKKKQKPIVELKPSKKVLAQKKSPEKKEPSGLKSPQTKSQPKVEATKVLSKPAPLKPAPLKPAPLKPAPLKPVPKIPPRPRPMPTHLPPGYTPSEDDPFMNEYHRLYFKLKLLQWKEDIIRQTKETLEGLHEDSVQHADLADRATSETDRALELRARDRQRKLISKIDAALSRIEEGTYGYCEETGEPIGIKRLDARPIATLSLEAQERHERREKVYREE